MNDMYTAKEIQWAIKGGLKLVGQENGRLKWEGTGGAWYWFHEYKRTNFTPWVKTAATI